MEVVVSPLTFGQGSKRRFGSSPIHSTSNPATGSTEDFDMDDDCTPGGDGYGFQSTKRRRRGSGEGLGTEASSCSFQVKENWSPSPFAMAPGRSPMAAVAGMFNYIIAPPPSSSIYPSFMCSNASALTIFLHHQQLNHQSRGIVVAHSHMTIPPFYKSCTNCK